MSPTKFVDFHYGAIGSYKPGVFYSESFSGVPWEFELYDYKGVGRESSKFTAIGEVPGGLQKMLRVISLTHETSHYVHDLSLGACIEHDYLIDEYGAVVFLSLRELSTQKNVRCPLLDKKNLHQWLNDSKLLPALEFVQERARITDLLISTLPNLAHICCTRLSPIFNAWKDNLKELSGLSLLEGIVAVKTVISMELRIKDEEDEEFLKMNRNYILPEKLPPIYNIARHIFDETIGDLLEIGSNYMNDEWPSNYRQSPRFLSDTGFIFLADIALHIPPFTYTVESVNTGENTLEDFIPTYRFCAAIACILKNGEFPPADIKDDYNGYYRTLFNFIAKNLNWPTFEETNNAWMHKITNYKQGRKGASDGYKYRMLVERDLMPTDIVLGDAIYSCAKGAVPIFHLTPTGYKMPKLFADGDVSILGAWEQPSRFVYKVFHSKVELWKDTSSERLDYSDVLKDAYEKAPQFEQEIIYRSLFYEVQSAVLYKQNLCCPFARNGCDAAVEGCKEITNLEDIPSRGCCLRDYLIRYGIQISNVRWK